jgi:hypothetical protein
LGALGRFCGAFLVGRFLVRCFRCTSNGYTLLKTCGTCPAFGDRDALNYKGFQLGLNEGELTRGDFGSWRVFCYDYQTLTADELHIVTDKGSTAFANPSVTNLHAPNGKPAVFVGLFLMSQGAAKGEGGELLYYRTYTPAESRRKRP